MSRIGLKLWSTNLHYIPIARDLFERKIFDYIELFTVPGSLEALHHWKGLDIPFVLHAPHDGLGLNPGDRASKDTNLDLVRQVNDFFLGISPRFVIFHAGVDGHLEESIAQFLFWGEQFPQMFHKIVIENQPLEGLHNEACLGASVKEMREILDRTGRGFCFDSTHAICYSQSVHLPWKDVLKDFLLLKPVICHICDAHYSPKDQHQHLGDGEFDLDQIIGMLPSEGMVSLETPKESKEHLNDFVKDVITFRSFESLNFVKGK